MEKLCELQQCVIDKLAEKFTDEAQVQLDGFDVPELNFTTSVWDIPLCTFFWKGERITFIDSSEGLSGCDSTSEYTIEWCVRVAMQGGGCEYKELVEGAVKFYRNVREAIELCTCCKAGAVPGVTHLTSSIPGTIEVQPFEGADHFGVGWFATITAQSTFREVTKYVP